MTLVGELELKVEGEPLTREDLAQLPTGAATATNQATGNTSLAAILAKLSADPASQTTLAALLVQATTIASAVADLDANTDGIEAKLDTLHTDLTSVLSVASESGIEVADEWDLDNRVTHRTVWPSVAAYLADPTGGQGMTTIYDGDKFVSDLPDA